MKNMFKKLIVMVGSLLLANLSFAVEDGLGTNHVKNLKAHQDAEITRNIIVKGTNGNTIAPNVQLMGYTMFGTNVAQVYTNGDGSVFISGNAEIKGALWANSLNVGGGEVNVSNLNVLGWLTVDGEATNKQTVRVLTDFIVSSNAIIGDTLTVTNGATVGSLISIGNGTIGGSLFVSADGSFSNLTVGNNLVVSNDVTIMKNAYLQNELIYGVTTQTLTAVTDQINAVGKNVIKIDGTGGIDIDAVGNQISNGKDGQIITILGTSDINWIKIHNGDGIILEWGISFTMGDGDILKLMFDGTNWREISRKDYGSL